MLKSAIAMVAAMAVAGANAGNYNGGDSGYGDTPSYDNSYDDSYQPPVYHPPPPPPPPPSCETCYSWDGYCPITSKYTPYTWVRKYNYKKCVDYSHGDSSYFPDCSVCGIDDLYQHNNSRVPL